MSSTTINQSTNVSLGLMLTIGAVALGGVATGAVAQYRLGVLEGEVRALKAAREKDLQERLGDATDLLKQIRRVPRPGPHGGGL